MGVISGIGGAVDSTGTVRTWQVSATNDVQSVYASNTKGMPVVQAGNDDWSGSYTAYGHTPAVMPGDGFTFTGSVDGTNGVTGTAIVDSVEIVINIEGGEKIGHTVNFSGNGDLSKGAAAATDATSPDTPTSIGTKCEIATPDASPTYSEISDVRQMTLTITSENPDYVSSSTSGGTRRTAGNLSATVSISVYTDDFDTLPDEGEVVGMKIYVNATEFWDLDWIRVSDISDMGADIEGAALVEATINGSYTGFTTISTTVTEGSITQPDATEFWPGS